jgi:hypothetical protein
MQHPETARTRSLTIIAQDPSITVGRRILRATVDVRAETLGRGPWGHRVQVIDYDASTGSLYKAHAASAYNGRRGACLDPFARATDRELLDNPQFHAQNAYAIAMRTLARFEFALGRRVGWGFKKHQLKIAPHAFADANAFYSADDEALVFGYFPGTSGDMVFSCLSHDVVAHETTHALLDGVRHRYLDPSSPDQAAFHEGYADIVALLSVFSLSGIAELLIDHTNDGRTRRARDHKGKDRIRRSAVTPGALKRSMILGLAEQMGAEMSGVRGQALRHSAELTPSAEYYNNRRKFPDYVEPHQRGEILVAAILHAFVHVWVTRLRALGEVTPGFIDRQRAIEEGAGAADYLLTMSIRALDYMPPTHILFGDFLSALITADLEIRPNDAKYRFRQHLREAFAAFGITAACPGTELEPGRWTVETNEYSLARARFESMQRDPDEVYGFIWENRKKLELDEEAYGEVLSVRPCVRIGPDDGFPLRETVVEFYQVMKVTAAELKRLHMRKPRGMPDNTEVSLYGGSALVFDEFGRLKYNIHNRINNARRQQARIDYLWEYGFFDPGASALRRFSAMHTRRAMAATLERRTEGW